MFIQLYIWGNFYFFYDAGRPSKKWFLQPPWQLRMHVELPVQQISDGSQFLLFTFSAGSTAIHPGLYLFSFCNVQFVDYPADEPFISVLWWENTFFKF